MLSITIVKYFLFTVANMNQIMGENFVKFCKNFEGRGPKKF